MNKIYQLKSMMGLSFTLTVGTIDLRVDFKNGRMVGEGVIEGGRYLTDDPDVMAAMEETPWFKRGEMFIYAVNDGKTVTVNKPVQKTLLPIVTDNPIKANIPSYAPLAEIEPEKEEEGKKEVEMVKDDGLITSDATNYQEARTWLKIKYPTEPAGNFQGAVKVKEFAAKNGIVFPNWI